MATSIDVIVNKALDELASYGLLLKSDPKLPSVTTLVAGGPVRGSWWSHPKGHLIFRVLGGLEDREEATVVKLISGKDTFIHRRLFPALASIGTARQGWQMKGLSAAGRRLLDLVYQQGAVRTDSLEPSSKKLKGIGEAARELEAVLRVRGENVHTSRGKHAKVLESWERWAVGLGYKDRIPAEDAMSEITELMESLNTRFQAKGKLPWPPSRG